MLIVRWGLRRIAFTLGAVLLVGGWGVTKYGDAQHRAAASPPHDRWQETARPAAGTTPRSDAGSDNRTAHGAVVATGLAITRQLASPSSWLYLSALSAMVVGAAVMALTVPWRGERAPVASAATPEPMPVPAARAMPMAMAPVEPRAPLEPLAPLQAPTPAEPTESQPRGSLPEPGELAAAATQPPAGKGKVGAAKSGPKPIQFKRSARARGKSVP